MASGVRRICAEELKSMDKRFRTNLVNSISGFKSANLIATCCPTTKRSNLGIFSSVVHLGANPALLGFIQRPTVNVSKNNEYVVRNTYENIQANPYFSINHIHSSFIAEAHSTAKKYDKNVNEFEECGLTEQHIGEFSATTGVPFVGESAIKIGLKFEEECFIKSNNTRLIVGSVQMIEVPDEVIAENGYLDLETLGVVAISGLDSYHSTHKLQTFKYE